MAKKSVLIFSVFVIVLSLILPLMPINSEEAIYDNTLRLHIMANSDSEYDQALKLAVRDRILQYFKEENSDSDNIEKTRAFVLKNKGKLTDLAKKTVHENGYDYDVKITLSQEYYPTKEYKDVKMPAGYYMSLRILIGDADGHNWWCVLYPPLCTGTAEVSKTLKEAGFTRSQINILTDDENPKYVARFKILEYLQQLFK